ncbi:MAG TPA: hypothetical protein VN258_16100 [Mobilitalea sp.]|nr:hypothetical protein [Mobilitalea sp.]
MNFISAYKTDGKAKLEFFLVDSDENILYEFPDFLGNTWAFYDMSAVSFKDVNNDGLKDIIVIAEYITGVGENGATPFNVAGIYFQKDNEFIELPELDNELNDNSKNQTIDMIIKYLKGREIKLE